MVHPLIKRHGDAIKKWLPVVLWATLIFYFSTDQFSASQTALLLTPLLRWFFPGISPERVQAFHFALRKLGHVSEYVVLAVLLLHALNERRGRRINVRYAALAFVIVLLYAISDEVHQSFVPDRTPTVSDVLIDLFGGVCGIFWALLRSYRNREG